MKTREKQNKVTPSEENWTSPDCKTIVYAWKTVSCRNPQKNLLMAEISKSYSD